MEGESILQKKIKKWCNFSSNIFSCCGAISHLCCLTWWCDKVKMLNVKQCLLSLPLKQRCTLTKTSSSSNSVHVSFPILRHIQVYHQVDLLCIYTSWSLKLWNTKITHKVIRLTEKWFRKIYVDVWKNGRFLHLTRSVEMSTLHWYCFSFDIASSLWSWLRPPAEARHDTSLNLITSTESRWHGSIKNTHIHNTVWRSF